MAPKVIAPKKPAPAARSLAEFLAEKRREGCPICALSDDVKAQLKLASKRSVKRADQIEWLEAELGVTLTTEQITAHYSGQHERAA